MPQVKHCFQSWGRICKEFTEGQEWCTAGRAFRIEELELRDVDVYKLTDVSAEESKVRIKAEAAKMKPWTGKRYRVASL